MPVAIGNELKLEDNKVNAEYGELFRKLNVAKAWTNITTTESGGTVTVIVGDAEILDNIQCGYNDWYVTQWSTTCVIDGKLYKMHNSLNQIGDQSNWKMCTRVRDGNMYAINSSGELYYFTGVGNDGTYTSTTKITASNNWATVCTNYGISNGKLYKLNESSVTQIGDLTGWEKISIESAGDALGICDGCVYSISGTTATALSANNDFVDVINFNHREGYAINSSGELYRQSESGFTKTTFEGVVKQISMCATASTDDSTLVTADGKLYYGSNDTWYELGSGKNWTWTCTGRDGTNILAIGDNKLWKIIPSQSGGTITQVGSSSGYKKVFGGIEIALTNGITLAWTGNATHLETTIYTTQHPKTSDKTYSDLNLTQYGTVTAYTGSSITSNSKVFDSDISKNGSFTAIPAATVHETVSVADILRATE